jgi:transcriptional regulator with XRE-family HTH domain
MTGAHLSEYENWPGTGIKATGRKPSAYLLAVLSAVYGCHPADLIDHSDRSHLPAADLLVIDTYARKDMPGGTLSPVPVPEESQQVPVADAGRKPNMVLRWIREQERHETREEFAQSMARVARQAGLPVSPDAKYVERLESGYISYPGPGYRSILAELCGPPFGELGFSATPSLLQPADDAVASAASRMNVPLRNAIVSSGLELSQIARRVGVDVKSVQRWVTQGVIPHPRHRWKTCEILGADESDLWPDAVTGQIRTPEKFGISDSPEPGPDTIVLNLRVGGREVAVPISRRLLLRAGVSSFVAAFAFDQQFDVLHDVMQRPGRAERLSIASPAHLQEILIHLHEQWHALVKTDNLLGPRFALAGVLNQISVVEALRSTLRDDQRIEVTRLGAKYAESAAWLYEDTDNMMQARSWTSQAMEWAYEGNDERMLAWTIFRRAQQAAAIPDAAQTIGLAQAARRNEEELATPTRAAIRVQEAYGHALDGNDQAAQRLLDEAHTWAASDTVGDAREGHGSYRTPDYLEIQRGHCWLAAGQPKKAIPLYEDCLRTLPTVYQRNRAATLTRLAVAYAADSQPEQAANTARAALPVARSTGSKRIVGEIKNVGTELIPHRALPAVATLLDELEAEDR